MLHTFIVCFQRLRPPIEAGSLNRSTHHPGFADVADQGILGSLPNENPRKSANSRSTYSHAERIVDSFDDSRNVRSKARRSEWVNEYLRTTFQSVIHALKLLFASAYIHTASFQAGDASKGELGPP